MPTWPAKTNYATGDVLTAAQMQDIGNALNSVGSAQYAAGKNKIINGDFTINQRAFSSTTTDNTYTFDRWQTSAQDGTSTFSAQTFTSGTAPVTGYEATNFLRVVTTGQTAANASTQIRQRIEDVRNFANQTVTISLWAKANSGTPKIAIEAQQNFGSGGSTTVNTLAGQITLSTSWQRYSVTVAIPSVSGKTIGTGSYLGTNLWMSAGTDFNARTGSLGIQTNTFEIWGVQVEAGSTATPFQTATGTLAGELQAAQRYYQVIAGYQAGGNAYSTTAAVFMRHFPVVMRTAPTPTYPATLTSAIQNFSIGNATPTAVTTGNATTQAITFYATGATGLTAYNPTFWSGLDIALSSEL